MVTSDAAVISRVRAGEVDAFGVLVERYHDRCSRLALRMLGDADDAADAVQDAFIRAYMSLDRYQERDRFGSWLMCIVANRCRSAADGAMRRARIAGEWWQTHAGPTVTEGMTPSVSDPALQRCLAAALGQLPTATRRTVVRKYAYEMSYDEIAVDTGVAVSALKMRVARGSAQLRRTLAGAGITVAAVALILVSHKPRDARRQPAAVVACDTLRALMRDTLGRSGRDSILELGRCSSDSLSADSLSADSLSVDSVHGSVKPIRERKARADSRDGLRAAHDVDEQQHL